MSHSSSYEPSEPQSPREPRGPRRGRAARGGRRPLDVTLALAVVLPLVAALALFLTNPGFGTSYFHPPTTLAVSRAAVVCPGSVGSNDALGVAAADAGSVTSADQPAATSTAAPKTSKAAQTTDTDVPAHGVGKVSAGKAPVLVTASGSAAPGLTGTRSSTDPVAAATCASPRADQWFTGVGAGPTHDSFVVLVNPNPGQAVADLTLLGDTGPLDVPRLRGIALPGNSSQEIDLGAITPTQSPLALHAVVSRGQVAVAVRDRASKLVGGGIDEDWLPAQASAGYHDLLLGLAPGDGARQLTVANPGDRELSATLRLVSADSTFTPENSPTIDVGPQSVTRVDLTKVLSSSAAKDALGVQVVANGPVTASLRSLGGGDVSLISRSASIGTATTAVVPTGSKQLLLGGATKVGAVTVVSRNAAGDQLSSKRVAISPQQGVSVPLPDGAVRVDVTPDGTTFRGSVMVTTKSGTAVVQLQRQVLTSKVPFVKPGLPR